MEDDKYNWDHFLPYFTFAFNSTVHFATKYTPFELVFGENNSVPDGILNKTTNDVWYNLDDFAKELKTKLKFAIEDAQVHINKQKEMRNTTKVKNKDIEIGDFILVKNEVGDKLDTLWKSPYEVVKIDKGNCYYKNKILKANLDNVKIYKSTLVIWIEDKE